VGNKGVTNVAGHGEADFYRAVARKKNSRDYKEVSLAAAVDGQVGQEQQVKQAVKRDMLRDQSNPMLMSLVEKLIRMNQHQIMEMTNGQITIQGNRLKTPLGFVTLPNILEAKKLLEDMEKLSEAQKNTSRDFLSKLEQYLMLVPQKIPSSRGWDQTFFNGFSSFQAQGQLLDQLEQSLDGLEEEVQKSLAEQKQDLPKEKVFKYELELVEDDKVIRDIEKFFKEGSSGRHASSHLKLKRVYLLRNPEKEKVFQKVSKIVGNTMRLWHGTRAGNVLSILKSGLIVPKSGGSFRITGRMFGDGLYFSDQSTKSLNYAYGYWDHGAKDNNCFMFLCDVAMGKMHVPSGPGNGNVKGYHSCFAKAHQSGVINNEMIVYDVDQAQLTYLCEFDL
jgi:poly [ADP-ribose] polymerase